MEEGFPLASSKSVNKMSKLFKKVFLDCVYIKSYRLMGVTAHLSIGFRSQKHFLHKAVGEKRNHSMKVEWFWFDLMFECASVSKPYKNGSTAPSPGQGCTVLLSFKSTHSVFCGTS